MFILSEKGCGVDFGITTILRRVIDTLLRGKEIWDEQAIEMISKAIQTVPHLNFKLT